MGGGIRHLSNFLPELGRADRENEYVVLTRGAMSELSLAPNVRVEPEADAAATGKLRRVMGDLIDIPRKVRREGFDLVVSLMNFGPIWSPVPHIVFQRNSLYFCEYYFRTAPAHLKAEALVRRRLASAMMTRARLIVTPSDSMQAMIRHTCPETRSREFRTIYHGFDSHGPTEPLRADYAARMDAAPGVKLFFPAHPAHHKGFEIIFRALARLRDRGVDATLFTTIEHADWPPLVAAYERELARLGIRDRVVFMGRVPQSQMAGLYQRADLMVFPSLCESFGFPMVESMGYGLPVVAAGTGVNREICGDAAMYYAPFDYEQAADRIAAAMNAGERAAMRARGTARIGAIDWGWKRYAREFASMIRDV